MPYMQRHLGWRPHAGELRYPASHGCIRLTADFAVRSGARQRLDPRDCYRDDVAPVEISSTFVRPKTDDDQASRAKPENIVPTSDLATNGQRTAKQRRKCNIIGSILGGEASSAKDVVVNYHVLRRDLFRS